MSLRVCYCATGPFIELALYSGASVFLAAARPDDVVVELFVGQRELADAVETARRLHETHGWKINARPMTRAIPASAETPRIKNAFFFRFVLPELFPDDERLIYLDADTIVVGDIARLAECTLEGFAVAACIDLLAPSRVYDHFNCAVHRQRGLCDYFNSGVLLFDCRRWIELRPAWRQLLERAESFVFPDQDVLNLLLHDAIGRLTDDWNVPPIASFLAGGTPTGDTIGRYSREDMLELERTAKLHHFISNTKPGRGKNPEIGASFENFYAIAQRISL
jgi:UDP-D-galactose:(glucosyl)LPS alpha-1,3-D-galactosyltransferase